MTTSVKGVISNQLKIYQLPRRDVYAFVNISQVLAYTVI